MRKTLLFLGVVALSLALTRTHFAPLFLADRADRATAAVIAAGLFTIAIAAVVAP